MRRSSIGLFACAVLAAATCAVAEPGSEARFVSSIKRTFTVGGRTWENVAPATAQSVDVGGRHFRHHCQVCHGLDGQGTGVPFFDATEPPISDLNSARVQRYTDGQLKWIIQNGIAPSGMPAWRNILSDEEMWLMVRYIRALPPKGSLGVPDVYREAGHEHGHGEQHGDAELEHDGEREPDAHTH